MDESGKFPLLSTLNAPNNHLKCFEMCARSHPDAGPLENGH